MRDFLNIYKNGWTSYQFVFADLLFYGMACESFPERSVLIQLNVLSNESFICCLEEAYARIAGHC